MSMTEEKKKKSRFRSRLTFLLLTLAVILGVVGYTYRTDIEMHIVHLKPQPVRKNTVALQHPGDYQLRRGQDSQLRDPG